jgi:hypothetical protein
MLCGPGLRKSLRPTRPYHGNGTDIRLASAVPLLLGGSWIVQGGTGMRAHILLRQRSDHRGLVLHLTVSACQWYSGIAPILSDRVAPYLVGRRPRIHLDEAHHR